MYMQLCITHNAQIDSGEEAADDMNDDGLGGADDDEIAV
jgi:hypothetical protein